MLGRKREEKRVLPNIESPAAARPLTIIERLKAVRSSKMDEFVKLNFEITELDSQIGYLERFPMIERVIESLRMRERA